MNQLEFRTHIINWTTAGGEVWYSARDISRPIFGRVIPTTPYQADESCSFYGVRMVTLKGIHRLIGISITPFTRALTQFLEQHSRDNTPEPEPKPEPPADILTLLREAEPWVQDQSLRDRIKRALEP